MGRMKRIKESITEAEFKRLISFTKGDEEIKPFTRDRFLRIYTLLYYTGMRINEISQLRVFHLKEILATGEVKIVQIEMLDEKGEPDEYFETGESVTLEVVLETLRPLDELVFGYMIKDRLGLAVFGINTWHLKKPLTDLAKGTTVTMRFEFRMNLGPGSYTLTIAAHRGVSHITKNYLWQDNVLLFHVMNSNHPEFVGTAWLPPQLEYRIEAKR